jgi:hypothetical protein
MTTRARNLIRSMTLLAGVVLASLALSGTASAQPMHRGPGGSGRGPVSGRPGMSHGFPGYPGWNGHHDPGRGYPGGRDYPGYPGGRGFPFPSGGYGGGCYGGGCGNGGYGGCDGGSCGGDDGGWGWPPREYPLHGPIIQR